MRMMKRLDAYLSRLCEVLRHANRDAPIREYRSGLISIAWRFSTRIAWRARGKAAGNSAGSLTRSP